MTDYLQHYGVLGMKWGVRKDRVKLAPTVQGLSSYMRKNIQYDDVDPNNFRLKSPEQTISTKRGNCHDQVMLELDQLSKLGFKPKALFLIEANTKTGQGGRTHSLVYFENNGKTTWFENAWGNNEGVREYDGLSDLKKDVVKRWGSNSKYPQLLISDFGDQKSGSNLQEVVDTALETGVEEIDISKTRRIKN